MNSPSIPRSAADLIGNAVEGGGTLALSVDESWLQGRSLFGGTQLALALRALRRVVSSDIPIRSLQATFLAPVLHGDPVVADATVLRAGRSVTHLRAQLRQGNHTCLECTAILGAGRATELEFDAGETTQASPEQAFRLDFRPGITPNYPALRLALGPRNDPLYGGIRPSGHYLRSPAC